MNQKDCGLGERKTATRRRATLLRRLGMMALLVGALGTRSADAQTCDAARGALFVFDGSTPLVSATVKGLAPKGRQKFVGTGTLQYDDGSTLPLAVTAKVRNTRVTYTLTGRASAVRVKATIETEGCLASIRKLSMSLTGPGLRSVLRDPTTVGIAGIMAPGVVVIDASDAGAVSAGVDDPPGMFRVESTAPVAMALQPGTVVLAGVTGATPNGMIGIVNGVQSDGFTTTVTTAGGTLEDAFQFLDIELGQDGFSTASTGRPRIAFDGGFSATAMEDTLRIDRDWVQWVGVPGGPVRLGGRLDIDSALYVRVRVGLNPGLKTILTGSFEAGAMVEATGGFSVGDSFELVGPIRLGTIPVGPVTFVPQLALVAGIDGGFGGEMRAEASAGLTDVRVGFDCNWDWGWTGGKWNCSHEQHGNPFASATMDVDSHGSVTASAGIELALMVANIAGPYVTPNFFIRATADPDELRPWWVHAGLGVDAGVSIDVGPLDLSFTLPGWTLIDWEIARAPITLPEPTPTNPTTWLGEYAHTGFGPIRKEYRQFGGGTYYGNWSPITRHFSAHLGPLVVIENRHYEFGAKAWNEDDFYPFFGGPKVRTVYGDTSYGEQRFYGHIRWGNYNFETHRFYPDGAWMPPA